MSHLAFTTFLALLLAGAMALAEDRATRDRVYLGIYWFCSAMASVSVGAWIMHWVHG